MSRASEDPPLHPLAPPEPEDLGELSDDAITGGFRILQRVRGHRYSLDDVITAWEAARAAPTAHLCLELGSGIGSVLLMLAYKLRDAQFVAVEAQRNSFRLLEQNVARNQLSARVRCLHGDLRAVVQRELAARSFHLITGTPPYVPPGQATPSSDAQRAFARQEFRGGVEDYLAAMGHALANDGRAVVCADARFPERVFAGADRAGLTVLRRRDVVPRASQKTPLFSVFTLGRSDSTQALPAFVHEPPWEARDAQGARTEAYHALRRFFDLAPPADEAPSP